MGWDSNSQLIVMQIPIAIGIVSAPAVCYPRTFVEDNTVNQSKLINQ